MKALSTHFYDIAELIRDMSLWQRFQHDHWDNLKRAPGRDSPKTSLLSVVPGPLSHSKLLLTMKLVYLVMFSSSSGCRAWRIYVSARISIEYQTL